MHERFSSTQLIKRAIILCLFALPIGFSLTSCSLQRHIPYAEWSGENLKQLSIALSQYSQDNAGTIPLLNDPSDTRNYLYPYVGNSEVFTDPETKKPYLANPALSQKQWKRIADSGNVVAFYQERRKDGLRQVVFLDQHVSTLNDQDLASKLKVSVR